MWKGIRIILSLIISLASFHGISFGNPLEKGKFRTNFSQGFVYGQWILKQKGDSPFSLREKTGPGNALGGDGQIKAIGDREFFLTPEVTNPLHSPATTEIQKIGLSHFENGQLFEEKSSYRFGKTHLAGNNLDFSFNFISSLPVPTDKGKNTLSWTWERFKGNDFLDDIFKSIAILLEIKLNF